MTRTIALAVAAASFVIACGDASTPTITEPAGTRNPRSTRVDGGAPPSASSGSSTSTPSPTNSPPPLVPPADPAACTLDTRTVYLQDGKKIESLTARGTYWVRTLDADGNATEGDGFPRSLDEEPKMANGPCAGRSPCVLDARTVYFDGAKKVESIFAYGQYFNWGFDANGGLVPNAAFPQQLEQTQALAFGPCAGQTPGACVIDTRSLYFEGGVKIETMTATGRWWIHQIASDGTRSPTGPHGRPLEETPRMAQGPCKGRVAGACKLDTRAVYIDFDGTKIEEITAYGRYWANRLAADGSLIETTSDGVRLTDIARFVGPCTR